MFLLEFLKDLGNQGSREGTQNIFQPYLESKLKLTLFPSIPSRKRPDIYS